MLEPSHSLSCFLVILRLASATIPNPAPFSFACPFPYETSLQASPDHKNMQRFICRPFGYLLERSQSPGSNALLHVQNLQSYRPTNAHDFQGSSDKMASATDAIPGAVLPSIKLTLNGSCYFYNPYVRITSRPCKNIVEILNVCTIRVNHIAIDSA